MRFAFNFCVLFYFGCNSDVIAQPVMHPVEYQKAPNGVFSFVKSWAYAWDIIKHDNGKFEKTAADSLTAADTAHLYFTANCKTNVQGGYHIRYCNALKTKGKISLVFADGMPGYANEFDINITGKYYRFKPQVVYPDFSTYGKLVYKTTYSKLVLFQKDSATSKIISGYIDVRFVECSTIPGDLHKLYFYFRGYFKTQINAG